MLFYQLPHFVLLFSILNVVNVRMYVEKKIIVFVAQYGVPNWPKSHLNSQLESSNGFLASLAPHSSTPVLCTWTKDDPQFFLCTGFLGKKCGGGWRSVRQRRQFPALFVLRRVYRLNQWNNCGYPTSSVLQR